MCAAVPRSEGEAAPVGEAAPIAGSEGESVALSESGRDAILRLAHGDMRRVLNILQATAMAYTEVDEKAVYACTGNALPADIESVLTKTLGQTGKQDLANLTNLRPGAGICGSGSEREQETGVLDGGSGGQN